jgi:ATP-dependent protease ClpP protease subunit
MASFRPEFRINPDRSVEVFGEFNDELANKLLPTIARLRKAPHGQEPVTVFINSPGGDMRVLEILDGALNCQDQDGHTIPVVTVVMGNAFSAAADLLVYGDYAIAYPHSTIYFHGVRYGEVRQITAERARRTTEDLRRSNLEVAYKLARCMMPRIVHRYAILKNKFGRLRKGSHDENSHQLECFVQAIKPKVESATYLKIHAAMEHLRTARSLSKSIIPAARLKSRNRPVKQDEKVLCALVRHVVEKNAGTEWRLDEDGVSAVVNDYLILIDYQFGQHRMGIRPILLSFGVEFLTKGEYEKFCKIPSSDPTKQERFLGEKAFPKLQLFWYFSVLLCRNLLQGENPISAEDAYWIGVVDEVVDRLHGRRLTEEKDDDANPSEGAAIAPAPPASPQPTGP